MQSRQLKLFERWLEAMNCEMVTFGEYGKDFAAVLWMQWAEFVAIFKAKGGAVVTKMWAVSWDKCSGKVGVKETHTFSMIPGETERSRSMRCWAAEEQWCWPTVIMRERLKRFWGRALRALFVASRQLGFYRKVLDSFEFGQPNFSFHHLPCST